MSLADGDVVVIVPGVLGSKLERNGKTVWGHRHLVANVHRLVEVLMRDLALPAGAMDTPSDSLDDGVTASAVMRLPSIFPGFGSCDGYGALIDNLARRAARTPGRVVGFPYDWRQSNVVSATALRAFVHTRLGEQRARFPSARAVLIAHSMGGLVARYAAQKLDDDALIRAVICLGTPFLGAIDALDAALNGRIEFGPFHVDVGQLAPTLPSLAELLPSYPCIRTVDGLSSIADLADTLFLDPRLLRRRQNFHDALSQGASRDSLHCHIALSYGQSTRTLGELSADGRLRAPDHEDFGDGDGRVPRVSAFPPDWDDDARATFLGGRHATFHQQRSCYVHLGGVLTATPRRPQAVEEQVDIKCTPATVPGTAFELIATPDPPEQPMALRVRLIRVDSGDGVLEEFLRRRPDGSYRARLTIGAPGLFRWTVDPAPHGSSSVTPVSDLVLCAEA